MAQRGPNRGGQLFLAFPSHDCEGTETASVELYHLWDVLQAPGDTTGCEQNSSAPGWREKDVRRSLGNNLDPGSIQEQTDNTHVQEEGILPQRELRAWGRNECVGAGKA